MASVSQWHNLQILMKTYSLLKGIHSTACSTDTQESVRCLVHEVQLQVCVGSSSFRAARTMCNRKKYLLWNTCRCISFYLLIYLCTFASDQARGFFIWVEIRLSVFDPILHVNTHTHTHTHLLKVLHIFPVFS